MNCISSNPLISVARTNYTEKFNPHLTESTIDIQYTDQSLNVQGNKCRLFIPENHRNVYK